MISLDPKKMMMEYGLSAEHSEAIPRTEWELMAVMAALVTRQSPPRADWRNGERPKAGSGKPMAADSPSTKTRRFVSGSGRISGFGGRAIAWGTTCQPNFSLVAWPAPVRTKTSAGEP